MLSVKQFFLWYPIFCLKSDSNKPLIQTKDIKEEYLTKKNSLSALIKIVSKHFSGKTGLSGNFTALFFSKTLLSGIFIRLFSSRTGLSGYFTALFFSKIVLSGNFIRLFFSKTGLSGNFIVLFFSKTGLPYFINQTISAVTAQTLSKTVLFLGKFALSKRLTPQFNNTQY